MSWFIEIVKIPIEKWFQKGKIDVTLFSMKREQKLLIIQVYMDDIIFGATSEN